MLSEVLVGLVVEAFDGGFLECSIHAFDLSVGPGVFRFGQAVVDVGLGAGELEGVSAEELSLLESKSDLRGHGVSIAGRGEVHAVIGEHGVNFIGHGLDQRSEEVGCYPLRGLFMHLDKGELGGAVDGDQELERALFGPHLGDIDMEVADRVGFELFAPGLVAIDLRQPGDPVPLQAAVQRRAGQLRDRGL